MHNQHVAMNLHRTQTPDTRIQREKLLHVSYYLAGYRLDEYVLHSYFCCDPFKLDVGEASHLMQILAIGDEGRKSKTIWCVKSILYQPYHLQSWVAYSLHAIWFLVGNIVTDTVQCKVAPNNIFFQTVSSINAMNEVIAGWQSISPKIWKAQ